MRFYINGPKDEREGVYDLITETGECVASHFCSHLGFAYGDVTTTFTKRRSELEDRSGKLERVVEAARQVDAAFYKFGDTPPPLIGLHDAVAALDEPDD